MDGLAYETVTEEECFVKQGSLFMHKSILLLDMGTCSGRAPPLVIIAELQHGWRGRNIQYGRFLLCCTPRFILFSTSLIMRSTMKTLTSGGNFADARNELY